MRELDFYDIIDPKSDKTVDRQLAEYFGIDDFGTHKDFGSNIIKAAKGDRISYSDEYGPLLLVHLAAGLTVHSFGGRIGASPSTIHAWIDKHPMFYAFHEAGLQFQRMDWEQTLVDMAKGKNKGNAAAAIFALKNYFPDDFKDKREVEMQAGQGMILVDTGIQRDIPYIPQEEGIKPRINRRRVFEAESREVEEIQSSTPSESIEDLL